MSSGPAGGGGFGGGGFISIGVASYFGAFGTASHGAAFASSFSSTTASTGAATATGVSGTLETSTISTNFTIPGFIDGFGFGSPGLTDFSFDGYNPPVPEPEEDDTDDIGMLGNDRCADEAAAAGVASGFVCEGIVLASIRDIGLVGSVFAFAGCSVGGAFVEVAAMQRCPADTAPVTRLPRR